MSADTTWPAQLTRTPRVADFEEFAPDVSIRSEVDVGPAKIRRRFTGDHRKFNVAMDFTRADLAVFDTFYLTTTKGGSLSFSWVLPRTGAAADFRFLSVPTYRPTAPRGDGSEWWRVSFAVEMLPGTDSSIPPPPSGSGAFVTTIAAGGAVGAGGGDSADPDGDSTYPDGEEPVVLFVPYETAAPGPEFWPGLLIGGAYPPPWAEEEADAEELARAGLALTGSYYNNGPPAIIGGALGEE